MKRMLIILGSAVVVVGVALLLWSKFGGGIEAMEAVPADALVVASFDVVEIYDTYTSDRVGAFLGEIDPDLAAIDNVLEREVGLTFSDDVLPWVGGTAALWMSAEGEEPGSCLVVSARDRRAADEFVSSVVALSEDGSVVERSVDGGTVYDVSHEDDMTGSLGRVDGVVLACVGEGAIDQSVAAIGGESMADVPEVAEAVAGDSLVVTWVDLPTLAEVTGEMDDLPMNLDPQDLAPAILAFDVTDRGFEWRAHTDSTMDIGRADASLAALLPEGTFLALLVDAPGIDIPGSDIAAGAGEFADLLRLMEGPLVLGVNSEETLVAEMLGAPLNVIIGAQSADPQALADEVIGLVGESFGIGPEAFVAEEYDAGTFYVLEFPFFGEIATMAVSDEYVAISGSTETATAQGPRLVDSDRWAVALEALSPGSTPSFYFDADTFRSLDLVELLDLVESQMEGEAELPEDLPSPEQLIAADQLSMVVAGTGSSDGSITMELIMLVNWEE